MWTRSRRFRSVCVSYGRWSLRWGVSPCHGGGQGKARQGKKGRFQQSSANFEDYRLKRSMWTRSRRFRSVCVSHGRWSLRWGVSPCHGGKGKGREGKARETGGLLRVPSKV